MMCNGMALAAWWRSPRLARSHADGGVISIGASPARVLVVYSVFLFDKTEDSTTRSVRSVCTAHAESWGLNLVGLLSGRLLRVAV